MYLKENFITILLYCTVTIFTINFVTHPSQSILVWPAVGIGIIIALVWGYKVMPGLYLAQFIIGFYLYYTPDNYDLDKFILSNIFIAVGLFRCYFGAFLIRYFIGYPNSFVTFSSIFKLMVLVGLFTSFITSILFSLIKIQYGFISTSQALINFTDWWFGDYIGFVIFTPLTLILIGQPKSIWQKRLVNVGLPIITLFIIVLILYNKALQIDNNRIVDNFKIEHELLSSKINNKNIWLTNFSKNINPQHANTYNKNNLKQDLNYLVNNNDLVDAVIFINSNEKINLFSKNNFKQKYNDFTLLQSIINNQKFIDNQTTITYSAKLGAPIKVIKLDSYSGIDTIIFILNLGNLVKTIDKSDLISIDIKLINSQSSDKFILNKTLHQLVLPQYKSSTQINLFNEKWQLIQTPSDKYFINHKNNLNTIIAKIGFIATAIISIMLLILSGKSILTEIQVKERTLELDNKVKDFKRRKKQYQTLIEQHPVILWRLYPDNQRMTYISKKVEKSFGYKLNDWLDNDDFWINHIHEDDKEKVKSVISNSLQNKESFELEYRFIKADGSIANINDVVNINEDKNFRTQLIGLMIDISETKNAIENQILSDKKYKTLFKYAADALIIVDLDDNTIKDFNDKANDLFDMQIKKDQTLLDFSLTTQKDGAISKSRLKKIYNKLNTKTSSSFEWMMKNAENEEIICRIEIVKLPETNRNIALVNITDITKIRRHEKKINQLAYYDNLTKLPNREYFYSKFEYFHEQAIKKSQYGTILYLDLDRFKILNDSLGHQAGDELLIMVAQRIRKVCKKNNFCARLGGDEFIIMTKKFANTIEASLENSLVKADLILEALNEPYQLRTYEHFITPSIGISTFPYNDFSIDQIIHQADIAMYASKEKGKNTITVYQENMVKKVGERLKLEKAIRQAFDKNQFKLHYQPQVNESGKVLAVEALLRWNRSNELCINTENLIDTIEKIGLTHEIGYWVLDQACSQLEKWQLDNHSIESIAVNVSAKQFQQKLFVDQIKSVIESYNLTPSQIVIELTEAILVEDVASVIIKLNELRDYGVRISLDDFGTGYSSLAYLKFLPIDQLKIDKMFIHDLNQDNNTKMIIKTIIDLAQSLNIELICEGIELKKQFDTLKELGCHHFQGYYFYKALPKEEIMKLKND